MIWVIRCWRTHDRRGVGVGYSTVKATIVGNMMATAATKGCSSPRFFDPRLVFVPFCSCSNLWIPLASLAFHIICFNFGLTQRSHAFCK